MRNLLCREKVLINLYQIVNCALNKRMDVSFRNNFPHMLVSQRVILWFRVTVTGWCGWHTLRLAQSLVVAEGQFWWSLSRQDGIVGRAESGRALRLICRLRIHQTEM